MPRGFRRLIMAQENKKQKNRKVEPTIKKSKKRIIIKYLLIVLVVGLLIFMTYRYTEEVKEKSYLQGGQNAISLITDAAESKGGVSITSGNETIVLSKYHKKIASVTPPTTEETPTEEIINQTE